MIADTAQIRSRLEALQELPMPVCSWVVEENIDSTDEPAVWVWAMLDCDEVDVDASFRLKSIVRQVVDDVTGLWAYVGIRGVNEPEAI